ncbi:MAG: choice-of-anchor tandem repeat GloVer-containing protein, partial [Terriglobales bacterium]
MKPSFFLLLAGFDSWRWALSVLLLCAAMAMAAAAQTFDTLVDFNGTKGAAPYASLVQGTDGNLYGTTDQGGDLTCGAPYGCGTVFRVTPGGTLTTLHRFESTDGDSPAAQLLLATDGNFYGTTLRGGVD